MESPRLWESVRPPMMPPWWWKRESRFWWVHTSDFIMTPNVSNQNKCSFFFFFFIALGFPPQYTRLLFCFFLLFWFLLCNRFRFGGGFPPSEGSDCAGRQAPRVSLLLQQHFSFPAAQPSHFFCFGFQGTEATDIISFFLLSSFCRIGHSTMELLPPIRSWMIGWTCWSWSSGRSPAAALLCTV